MFEILYVPISFDPPSSCIGRGCEQGTPRHLPCAGPDYTFAVSPQLPGFET